MKCHCCGSYINDDTTNFSAHCSNCFDVIQTGQTFKMVHTHHNKFDNILLKVYLFTKKLIHSLNTGIENYFIGVMKNEIKSIR